MTISNIKDINIQDLKRPEMREKVIYIRTTQEISEWMKENKISPSKLFNDCAKILMIKN